MNKNVTSAIIITLIIAGGTGFYGGMKYGGMKATAARTTFTMGSGTNQFGQLANAGGNDSRGGGRIAGVNTVTGEILSKDNGSLVIKLPSSGSRIVLLSDRTDITKSASGSVNDLSTGTTVSIFGSSNQDGSITADIVQIRPIRPADQIIR